MSLALQWVSTTVTDKTTRAHVTMVAEGQQNHRAIQSKKVTSKDNYIGHVAWALDLSKWTIIRTTTIIRNMDPKVDHSNGPSKKIYMDTHSCILVIRGQSS